MLIIFSMFKASLLEPDLLKIPISAIAELIDEGIFKINKDGISLRAADRAMVAVVDFKILSTAFDEYNLENETEVGLNIEHLLSVLKRASRKNRIILELEGNKFNITLSNGSTRKFLVPVLEISQEEIPPIEQLQFTVKAEIKPETLRDAIKDADIISDAVTFEAQEDKFIIKAEGDISQAEVVLEKGSEDLFGLEVKEAAKARYPIDYLKKMIKAAKLAESAVIEFAKDYPMKLTFSVLDKVKLSFVLAPRVIEE